MLWGDVATWVGSAGAVVTGIFAVWLGATLKNREQRQAMSQLHVDLTSGEVAGARHVVGTVLYGGRALRRSDCEHAIQAYYVLMWSVERVANLRMVFGSRSRMLSEPFLDWNLDEIVNNVIVFRNRHGHDLGIDDLSAWNAFTFRVRAIDRRLYEKHFSDGRDARTTSLR